MLIRCWGARGSVPVSGESYVRYGGDTTCLEIVSADGDEIVIDAGTGIRNLGNRLVAESVRDIHLIFTHAHWDHIIGFPFFKPFFNPETLLRMYRCPDHRFVERMLSYMMQPPFFPVKYAEGLAEIRYVTEAQCDPGFRIGSIEFTPIPLSHPNTGRGFRFSENGKSAVFLTDNEIQHRHPGGLIFDEYVAACQGADLLIHDAEYTPEEYGRVYTWGHSTMVDAVDLALAAGVRRLALFHLNQDRSDEGVDLMVERCRELVRERRAELEVFAMGTGVEISL
jgi:phosphoribosyl 1,2-cyclic phosphodiesterase